MRHGLTLIAFTLVACAPAHAATFYAVEMSSARLQAVSSTLPDGFILDIGPLGRAVGDVDLAMNNGQLYATNIRPAGVEFLEINQTTGAATLLGMLTAGTQAVLGAESLAVRNGQLWVSYSFTVGGVSNRLGILNLDGTINLASTQVTDRDIDALAWNNDAWRGTDVNAPVPGQTIFFGGVGPTFPAIRTFANTLAQINDVDYDAGQLWGMSYASGGTGGKLVHINPADGAFLESTVFSTTGAYSNLAAIVIPEPACLSLIAVVLCALRRRVTRPTPASRAE